MIKKHFSEEFSYRIKIKYYMCILFLSMIFLKFKNFSGIYGYVFDIFLICT